jgi:hypothetical protein
MPLVRRLNGRRVTKTRRRGNWIWVRLAAVPTENLRAEWIAVSPADYRAARTTEYVPTVVHVRIGGGR